MAPMSDPVNHPAHYHSSYIHESCGTPIECIDIVRHMDFDTGNAVKYCWRAGKKGDTVEDLEKAVWYLNDRISELKRARAKEERAPKVQVVDGIQFSILTAETANQNWAAFNREPFYLSLPDRHEVRDRLLDKILGLPVEEFDKLAPWVREAVVDWQWAWGRGE
jgi:hypothetical protein